MRKYYRLRKIINKLFDYEYYRIILCKFLDRGLTSDHIKNEKNALPYIVNNGNKERYIVIRISLEYGGHIMSVVRRIPGICEWAESKGYIPLFYLGHEEDIINKDYSNNFIDYFFDQNRIIDVQSGGHFFFEQLNYYPGDNSIDVYDTIKLDMTENWKQYYTNKSCLVNKWLKFNPDFIKQCDNDMGFIDDNSIGISFNENFINDIYNSVTGSSKEILNQHPLSGGISDLIEYIDEALSDDTSCIFVSCILYDTINTLKERYGDKVKYLERERKTTKEFVTYITDNPHQNGYSIDTCYGYVEEVIGLSRCGYVIGNVSSGLTMALAINGGKYKNVNIMRPIRTAEYVK